MRLVSDASKVPPSQFQKRKGSLYATPGSRDAHIDSDKGRDKNFHDKLKEKVRGPGAVGRGQKGHPSKKSSLIMSM